MRFKAFSLFLATQLISFAIWQGFGLNSASSAVVFANEDLSKLHTSAEQIVDPDIRSRNLGTAQASLNLLRERQVLAALESLPASHANTVKNIILDYSPTAHRGLGGNSLVILRGVNITAEELIGVLVHEVAHNVDYTYLNYRKHEQRSSFMDGNSPVYITDPSLDFYRISWEDDKTRKETAINLDFVSGYAKADPFEDFAEAYTYYVLHGNDFKELAKSSPNLYAKYRFMKFRVFKGQEFDTDDGIVRAEYRPWDTTVLSYDLNDFLI